MSQEWRRNTPKWSPWSSHKLLCLDPDGCHNSSLVLGSSKLLLDNVICMYLPRLLCRPSAAFRRAGRAPATSAHPPPREQRWSVNGYGPSGHSSDEALGPGIGQSPTGPGRRENTELLVSHRSESLFLEVLSPSFFSGGGGGSELAIESLKKNPKKMKTVKNRHLTAQAGTPQRV